MKLEIGHKEIVAGLCMYLQSRGVVGFDPAEVHAEFSFVRGTKELACTLDEDAPVGGPAAEPKTRKPRTPAAAAPVTETQATGQASGQAIVTPAVVTEVVTEVAPVEVVAEVEAPAEEPVVAAEDENLFA